MADHIVLLVHGDERRAREIVDAFGERTGLTPDPLPDGASFAIHSAADHRAKIVGTLNEIDRDWSRFLAFGDPDSR
jgi:hypothetical protein